MNKPSLKSHLVFQMLDNYLKSIRLVPVFLVSIIVLRSRPLSDRESGLARLGSIKTRPNQLR